MRASLKNENLKFDWRILQGFDPVKLNTETVNGQQNFPSYLSNFMLVKYPRALHKKH